MNRNWIHVSDATKVAEATEVARKYYERIEAEKLKDKKLCQKK